MSRQTSLPDDANQSEVSRIAKQIQSTLRTLKGGAQPVANDLATRAGLSHGAAANIVPPTTARKDQWQPTLPEPPVFRRIADALWADQPRVRQDMLAAYASVLLREDLVPARRKRGRPSAAGHTDDASKETAYTDPDVVIRSLGFVPERVPQTTPSEARGITAVLSKSTLGVQNIRLSKGALLALREGCCRFVAPTGRDGGKSASFFADIGTRGPLVVNFSVALGLGKTTISAPHLHERFVQVSLALSGEIRVVASETVPPDDLLRHDVKPTPREFRLSAGQCCLVPAGYAHAVSAYKAGSSQLTVTADVANETIGWELNQVAIEQVATWPKRRT
jgi:mannose-6-phosphate isomerase-like protein (cupin superfamily)